MHTNTKYWSFTWDTNIKQKKIPEELELKEFLNRICSEACFQYEVGSEKGKLHIQGALTLEGPRMSKAALLKLFEGRFKNVAGLTLTAIYDKVATQAYVTKTEGRVKGPFYAGKNEIHDLEFSKMKLRKWQQQLYDLLVGEDLQKLKDRKVIWVQNSKGNSGKSWFQKWLRIGQKQIVVRSLPVDGVDRIMSAVNIITKKTKIDVFCYDLTRTQGENQSFKDLFSTVEQIKNGYVIDCMYGKYNESYFDPPVVIIFTNEDIANYKHYLSEDRWLTLSIVPDNKGDLILQHKTEAGVDLFYYDTVQSKIENKRRFPVEQTQGTEETSSDE